MVGVAGGGQCDDEESNYAAGGSLWLNDSVSGSHVNVCVPYSSDRDGGKHFFLMDPAARDSNVM